MWFGSDVVPRICNDMRTDDFSQFIASHAYAFPDISIAVTQTFLLFFLAVHILIFRGEGIISALSRICLSRIYQVKESEVFLFPFLLQQVNGINLVLLLISVNQVDKIDDEGRLFSVIHSLEVSVLEKEELLGTCILDPLVGGHLISFHLMWVTNLHS